MKNAPRLRMGAAALMLSLSIGGCEAQSATPAAPGSSASPAPATPSTALRATSKDLPDVIAGYRRNWEHEPYAYPEPDLRYTNPKAGKKYAMGRTVAGLYIVPGGEADDHDDEVGISITPATSPPPRPPSERCSTTSRTCSRSIRDWAVRRSAVRSTWRWSATGPPRPPSGWWASPEAT